MLHTTTYKNTIQVIKKQYTNNIKQRQTQQKTNLLIETIAWTKRMLKTELKRRRYGLNKLRDLSAKQLQLEGLNRRNLDLTVRKLTRWKGILVKSKSSGLNCKSARAARVWPALDLVDPSQNKSDLSDRNPTARDAHKRRRRPTDDGERLATVQGGGLTGARRNRVGVLDLAHGFHRIVDGIYSC
jgi:hypothetical protein